MSEATEGSTYWRSEVGPIVTRDRAVYRQEGDGELIGEWVEEDASPAAFQARIRECFNACLDMKDPGGEVAALRFEAEALKAKLAKCVGALRPFAGYACEPPCGCHNCVARDALNGVDTSSGYRAIHIVFDGPPGPEPGRFVEVEDAEGHGVNVGNWMLRKDGYHVLVLNVCEEA